MGLYLSTTNFFSYFGAGFWLVDCFSGLRTVLTCLGGSIVGLYEIVSVSYLSKSSTFIEVSCSTEEYVKRGPRF